MHEEPNGKVVHRVCRELLHHAPVSQTGEKKPPHLVQSLPMPKF